MPSFFQYAHVIRFALYVYVFNISFDTLELAKEVFLYTEWGRII